MTLDRALADFEQFLLKNRLVCTRAERGVDGQRLFIILTDGPWDIATFLKPETSRKKVPLSDRLWGKWVDVRKAFAELYKVSRRGVSAMLEYQGLSFDGRPHSGRDDARAIAKISAQMLRDGFELIPNAGPNSRSAAAKGVIAPASRKRVVG